MKVIGLTGSLGMGKSTAAALLRRLGVRVHEADRVVHRLMAKGGAAVPAVRAAFPEAVRAGGVDRTRLAARVFADSALLARLESILHPMVRAESTAFLARARRARVPLAVLDVPLLFETGQDRGCDATVVVTAPAFVQRARAMARPGMTANRLALVLAHQMPDGEKRARADFVVATGLGRRTALRHLRRMLKEVRRGRIRGRRRTRSASEGGDARDRP
jgi:dephospho-CoA kinase